ncbi:MAG TPA: 3-oxoadipate enol-lactonase [Streptosporangiaceae bacterium]|nr:3-oxoadipate enol-lactonase [Streptosporangiaceae bacterium]
MSESGPARREAVPLAASLEGPADAPVLVLGNSLGTSRACWQPQVAALSRHFRLLRYELRGHGTAAGGLSPAPPGPYSVAELAGDVLALLDAHDVERTLYCGVSLGGMVGMWLAAHAPERIIGLGLSCTSAYLPPAAGWTDRAARVRAQGTDSIAEQVVGRWFTPAFRAAQPEVPAAFAVGLAAIGDEGYAGCCEAIAAMDLRPVLGSITAPTMVIAGVQDAATPPWHGGVIASSIAGSRLRVVRGGAHLTNVSAAGEVTALLLPHLLAATGLA